MITDRERPVRRRRRFGASTSIVRLARRNTLVPSDGRRAGRSKERSDCSIRTETRAGEPARTGTSTLEQPRPHGAGSALRPSIRIWTAPVATGVSPRTAATSAGPPGRAARPTSRFPSWPASASADELSASGRVKERKGEPGVLRVTDCVEPPASEKYVTTPATSARAAARKASEAVRLTARKLTARRRQASDVDLNLRADRRARAATGRLFDDDRLLARVGHGLVDRPDRETDTHQRSLRLILVLPGHVGNDPLRARPRAERDAEPYRRVRRDARLCGRFLGDDGPPRAVRGDGGRIGSQAGRPHLFQGLGLAHADNVGDDGLPRRRAGRRGPGRDVQPDDGALRCARPADRLLGDDDALCLLSGDSRDAEAEAEPGQGRGRGRFGEARHI